MFSHSNYWNPLIHPRVNKPWASVDVLPSHHPVSYLGHTHSKPHYSSSLNKFIKLSWSPSRKEHSAALPCLTQCPFQPSVWENRLITCHTVLIIIIIITLHSTATFRPFPPSSRFKHLSYWRKALITNSIRESRIGLTNRRLGRRDLFEYGCVQEENVAMHNGTLSLETSSGTFLFLFIQHDVLCLEIYAPFCESTCKTARSTIAI